MSDETIATKPGTPLAIRRRPLNTIDAVRKQAASLYWDARRGRITAQEASRMANVLAIIFRMIEGGELEERLAEVEARLENAATTTDVTAASARRSDVNDEDD